MDEKVFESLLKIPGVRKAAQGVIIPSDDGASFFHVTGVHSAEAMKDLTNEETFFLAFCSKSEILRLRELRTPHDYLLRFRAFSIVDSARAVRVLKSRRQNYEQGGSQWSLSHYYHSKDHYHKSYIKLLSREQRKLLINLPAGLAFVNQVNAMCIRSFVGDVVVASESLEWFYYYMNIGLYGDYLDIPAVDRMHAILIALRIMNGSESLDFDLDTRGNLPQSSERSIERMVANQMQFTFGHEYAHYLRNHVPLPETVGNTSELPHPHTENGGASVNDTKHFEHSLEYEADIYSIKNIQDMKMRTEVMRGACSVLLFLHFLTEVNRNLKVNKCWESDTHPDSLSRFWRIFDAFGKDAGLSKEGFIQTLEYMEQLKDILIRIINNSEQKDMLTFYGSVYLPTFKAKLQRDRIDF